MLVIGAVFGIVLLNACQPKTEHTEMQIFPSLNAIAEQYVRLVLNVGEHSNAYIDAYYGPEEWKPSVKVSLDDLLKQSQRLSEALVKFSPIHGEEQRKEFLLIQLKSVSVYIRLLLGEEISFNEESLGLYDAKSPEISEKELDKALAELNELLPGDKSLNDKLNDFNQQFVIPLDKLDIVFVTAIAEARERTKAHISLPETESFVIEYVTDKVWSGYNWYKGNNFSIIQLNTDFPIYINRAIDLASHEGYPGHHVFNSQMEQHLVNNLGWMEFSVYPLYSPMSLLAEGSANYGISVAFPKSERLIYEAEVLFPLAGLNPTEAVRYYQVQEKLKKLSYADNMVAKRYLDGEINKEQAINLLMKYALSSREKSTQRVGFIETHRAYVINYNLGQDLVRQYVNKMTEGEDDAKRWQVFAELLAMPKTASMMNH